MQIAVVALMCHTLASIPQPVCREEIVVKDEMPMQACMLSQAALADWKGPFDLCRRGNGRSAASSASPVTTSSRARSDASQPSIVARRTIRVRPRCIAARVLESNRCVTACAPPSRKAGMSAAASPPYLRFRGSTSLRTRAQTRLPGTVFLDAETGR
jgi:hypothetical protein